MERKSDSVWKWIIFTIFGGLFILAILGLIKGLAYGQGTDLPILKVSSNPARPGDLIVFEITNINESAKLWGMNARGNFGEKEIKFFWANNRLLGLAAIGLNQKPGLINASIAVSNNKYYLEFPDNTITILSKEWAERRVVATPPLSPKKLARYLKEKMLIKKALETTADAPLWQERFVAPVWGDCFVIRFIPTCSPMEETSPFGQKRISPTKTRQHRGVDLRAPVGRPVYSMNSGRVVLTGNFLADGRIVIVDHGLGLHTLYLHLSRIKVKKGQFIKRGQILGLSGNTGFSEGPHLHLEMRLNGEPVNPLQILEILK